MVDANIEMDPSIWSIGINPNLIDCTEGYLGCTQCALITESDGQVMSRAGGGCSDCETLEESNYYCSLLTDIDVIHIFCPYFAP